MDCIGRQPNPISRTRPTGQREQLAAAGRSGLMPTEMDDKPPQSRTRATSLQRATTILRESSSRWPDTIRPLQRRRQTSCNTMARTFWQAALRWHCATRRRTFATAFPFFETNGGKIKSRAAAANVCKMSPLSRREHNRVRSFSFIKCRSGTVTKNPWKSST